MVQGKVDKIDPKGEKTPWRVTIAGKSYSTFQDETIANLKPGMLIQFEPEIVTRNGRTFANLSEWKEIQEPSTNHQETTVPAHVWEAKDRRIAMEAAYKAAAEFVKALPSEKVESSAFRKLARLIYRDIQAAGDGKPFGDD